jgi:hypothetical protein
MLTSLQATRTSRTGRVIKAPAAFTPAPAAAGSGGKRRRGGKKTTSVNCAECGRGHSPSNNPIVFCDGCESAWHKHCHNPQIPDVAIDNLETEWKCSNCDPSQRRSSKAKPVKVRSAKAKKPAHSAPVGVRKVEPDVDPKSQAPTEVACHQFSAEEKRAWLSTLTHTALVDMLVDISTNNPSVPIFPANMRELVATKFTASPIQPTIAESASASSASRKRARTESAAIDELSGLDRVHPPKRPRTASSSVVPVATHFSTTSPSRRWSPTDTIGSSHFLATLANGAYMRVPHTSLTPALSPDAPSPFETGPLTDSEGEDIQFDDHRVYPKAGNGFVPSSDPAVLDILQEDPESKTFSHGLHGPAKTTNKPTGE